MTLVRVSGKLATLLLHVSHLCFPNILCCLEYLEQFYVTAQKEIVRTINSGMIVYH